MLVVRSPISFRLEQYTIKRKEEVLIVQVETPTGEEDTVLIYNGFSSSLTRPTIYDPDIPVIEEDATIISIDRVASPYNPVEPEYIQTGLKLSAMEKFLVEANV
ncbi:hypothetical protein Xen7305DRAFT_00038390 [Xenococcus sp. PCC 7305]|uniref:DUF7734 family protein n=1 Tax=Xenococcus sp. PCC 7305 TaxID=102125 RepID=UPI0002AC2F4E|nr:hypothetical protein Xen7305DRAFT_00038390 [Xenococcus sp. PCC 7305]